MPDSKLFVIAAFNKRSLTPISVLICSIIYYLLVDEINNIVHIFTCLTLFLEAPTLKIPNTRIPEINIHKIYKYICNVLILFLITEKYSVSSFQLNFTWNCYKKNPNTMYTRMSIGSSQKNADWLFLSSLMSNKM